tara:strand:+ start:698 stop:1042 length:345 start_codon:yes stop_codon:yes gene_type:complete
MKSFRQYCKEDLTLEDADGNTFAEVIDLIKPEPIKGGVQEATRIPSKTGNILTVMLAWRGSSYSIKMFFPQVSKPSRKEVQDQLQKVYPGAKLWGYQVSDHDEGEPLLQVGGAR